MGLQSVRYSRAMRPLRPRVPRCFPVFLAMLPPVALTWGCSAEVRDFDGGGGSSTSTTSSATTSTSTSTSASSTTSGGGSACAPSEERPCYTGPTGTQNIGPCLAGVQVCLADGSGFGPCGGERVPSQETCNGADDDCNGAIDDGAECGCRPGQTVLLDFEDALGPLGDAAQIMGGSTVEIQGVRFSSVGGEPTYNRGRDYGDNPFSSDWLMIWTFNEGGTIDFPSPVSSLRFEAGADNAVASPATFELLNGSERLLTVTLSRTSTVPVELSFAPTTRLTLRFVDGSTSLFGLDNLQYTCR
jgi:hypothetical protein